MKYLLLLIITWLINGSIKYAVNYYFYNKKALQLIGYGGFPSTHTAMITALLFYVGFSENFNHVVIAPLLIIFWLIVNDAYFLRNNIQDIAKNLNKLDKSASHRESLGHKKHEIIGGILVGFTIAYFFEIFYDTSITEILNAN